MTTNTASLASLANIILANNAGMTKEQAIEILETGFGLFHLAHDAAAYAAYCDLMGYAA